MTDVATPPEPAADAEAPRRRHVAPWIALGVAAALLALVVVLATSGKATDTASTPLLGKPAPVVQTETIDGQSFDLATRRGSWVVLNFFATWCPPCIQEHPELLRFARGQASQPDGAELVTVVNNDDPEKVREFFAENGGEWPVLLDPGGRVYVGFGVAKVPETWVIDPNGNVAARVVSTVTAEGLAGILTTLKQGGEP